MNSTEINWETRKLCRLHLEITSKRRWNWLLYADLYSSVNTDTDPTTRKQMRSSVGRFVADILRRNIRATENHEQWEISSGSSNHRWDVEDIWRKTNAYRKVEYRRDASRQKGRYINHRKLISTYQFVRSSVQIFHPYSDKSAYCKAWFLQSQLSSWIQYDRSHSIITSTWSV